VPGEADRSGKTPPADDVTLLKERILNLYRKQIEVMVHEVKMSSTTCKNMSVIVHGIFDAGFYILKERPSTLWVSPSQHEAVTPDYAATSSLSL
jgi:hypothetical protein